MVLPAEPCPPPNEADPPQPAVVPEPYPPPDEGTPPQPARVPEPSPGAPDETLAADRATLAPGAGTAGVSANLSGDGTAPAAPACARTRARAPALAGDSFGDQKAAVDAKLARCTRRSRTRRRRSRASARRSAASRAQIKTLEVQGRRRLVAASPRCSPTSRCTSARLDKLEPALPSADDPLQLPEARVLRSRCSGSTCG